MNGLPTGPNGVTGLRVPNHVGLDSKHEFDAAIKREQKNVLKVAQKADSVTSIFAKVIKNNV